MTPLFDLPRVTLPTSDGRAFPVRRIYCIGRNYADHVRELGGDPRKDPPIHFMKPADAVLPVPAGTGGSLPYPPLTGDLHYELELAVGLHSGGRDIPVAEALGHVWGYAAALDMTRRDRQSEAKAAGSPWEIAKSFDHSAPVGPLVPAAAFGAPNAGSIVLAVNGVERQKGDLADMIWSVAELIAELSRGAALAAGDLILTGTPAGVGAVRPGDTLVGTIRGLPELTLSVV